MCSKHAVVYLMDTEPHRVVMGVVCGVFRFLPWRARKTARRYFPDISVKEMIFSHTNSSAMYCIKMLKNNFLK